MQITGACVERKTPFFNDFIFYTSPCASSQLQGLVTTEPTVAHIFVWSSVIIKTWRCEDGSCGACDEWNLNNIIFRWILQNECETLKLHHQILILKLYSRAFGCFPLINPRKTANTKLTFEEWRQSLLRCHGIWVYLDSGSSLYCATFCQLTARVIRPSMNSPFNERFKKPEQSKVKAEKL